ncbi:hypothetical protein HFP72_27745 [Nocardiopsis sp. ARC36]
MTRVDMAALAALRRIHAEWSISTDSAGAFVAVRSDPHDVIRAALVETLGSRLARSPVPRKAAHADQYAHAGRPSPEEDILLMRTGQIRAITAVPRAPAGAVELHLGTTWHSYAPDQQLDLAVRGPR